MRLIVFDIDGTLIDSHAFITATMTAAFEAEGLEPPTPAMGRSVIGLSLPEALGRLSGAEGLVLDALVARYRGLYHGSVADGATHEALYPGAREAVLALAAHPETVLGIATGKALRGVQRVLTLHGFTEQFNTLQTPDHNPSKPHPGMLQRAMAETGAEPQETLMIGDTSFDMEMAKAAGCHALGVSWGYHPHEDLTKAGADMVIHDYAELAAAIETIMGRIDA